MTEEDSYVPRDGDIISETTLDGAVCPKCGTPLDFETDRDECLGRHATAECCGLTFTAAAGYIITIGGIV